MSDIDTLVDTIRDHHRQRRFAMKIQQKIDRALESYVRIHFTEWTPDLEEKDREALNKDVKALIKAARAGSGPPTLIRIVRSTDEARRPNDELRDENEKAMAKLAMQLPVWPWVESIRGAGALGLATIVAETGNLSNFP